MSTIRNSAGAVAAAAVLMFSAALVTAALALYLTLLAALAGATAIQEMVARVRALRGKVK